MTPQIATELLTAALLAAASVRIFFSGRITKDVLSLCPAAALFIAMCAPFAWGMDIVLLFLLLLSVLVCVTNLPYTIQFIRGLNFDRFSLPVLILSPIYFILSAGLAAMLIYFRPAAAGSDTVTETKTTLGGTLSTGLRIRDNYFSPINGFVSSYMPNNSAGEKQPPLVLFVPDVRDGIEGARPFCAAIAERGYEVIAAELYAADGRYFSSSGDTFLTRRFTARLRSRLPGYFSRNRDFFATRSIASYQALINLYGRQAQSLGRDVYLLGEAYGCIGIEQAALKNKEIVKAVYCIGPDTFRSSDTVYTEGFSCIPLTAPWIAAMMGIPQSDSIPDQIADAAARAFSVNTNQSEQAGGNRIDDAQSD